MKTKLIRIFIGCLLIGFLASDPNGWSDLIIFHNGDYRYGQVNVLDNGVVILTTDRGEERYKAHQVEDIQMGVDEPAPSPSGLTAAAATPVIPDITAPITTRKNLKDRFGKSLIIDIENGYDVEAFQLWPTRYAFFGRTGCFIAGILVNSSTESRAAIEFRATVYGQEDNMLTSKDFYVFRLPGSTPQGPGKRKFEIEFPDTAYQQVHRMRIVRKF